MFKYIAETLQLIPLSSDLVSIMNLLLLASENYSYVPQIYKSFVWTVAS